MNKKITIIVITLILFALFQPITFSKKIRDSKDECGNFIPDINFEIIENNITYSIKSETKSDEVFTYYWPNENSEYPWNLFEVPLYAIAIEPYELVWDDSGERNCWEYKQKVMWWTSNLNIYGEYCEEPYYNLDVDFWPEVEYGTWEGEAFRFGGWNVLDTLEDGDFHPWSDIIAHALIIPFLMFPVFGFPVSKGITLAKILFRMDDPIDPVYSWDAERVYDASGCFEYDFHVEPNTDYSKIMYFRFSSTPGDPFVKKIGIRLEGTSPTPPPEISLNPNSYNFGDIELDDSSEEVSFKLSNNGLTDQDVELFLSDGIVNHWKLIGGERMITLAPGEDKTINVKFSPQSDGMKEINLTASYAGGSKSSVLYGNGKEKSKYLPFFNHQLFERFSTFFINKR